MPSSGEQTCTHAIFIHPIIKALELSDLIILTSPVYGMDVSGQLKTLLTTCVLSYNPGNYNMLGGITLKHS